MIGAGISIGSTEETIEGMTIERIGVTITEMTGEAIEEMTAGTTDTLAVAPTVNGQTDLTTARKKTATVVIKETNAILGTTAAKVTTATAEMKPTMKRTARDTKETGDNDL